MSNKSFTKWFYPLTLLLCCIAFFYNYGYMQLIEDEAIRGLVALEMMHSGDFLTPTIGGDLYFKKPPLFNWIVAGSFTLFGKANEWSLRFPTIIFLGIYGFTIFYWTKKYLTEFTAFLSALFFLTCTRVILYESMLGLIDITFSWCIFMLFISIFEFGKNQRWVPLFLSVYFFGLLGYFFKGLPAPLFIGCSLLIYFITEKKFWKLFHWSHIVSFILFFSIITSYYWVYTQQNNIEFQTIFDVILNESSRRTASEKGFGAMALHLLTFPFELLSHLAPWSVLAILCINKKFIQSIKRTPFLKFGALILIANIWPYWLAPEFYPRYILMLIPFIFILIAHNYNEYEGNLKQYIHYPIPYIILLGLIIPFVPLFVDQIEKNTEVYFMSLITFISFSGIAYLVWKKDLQPILALVLFMLTIRIGFDTWILPVRAKEEIVNEKKRNVEQFLHTHNYPKPLYGYYPSPTSTGYYGRRNVTYDIMFFLSSKNNSIYTLNSNIIKDAPYLVPESFNDTSKFISLDTINLYNKTHPYPNSRFIYSKGK